MIFLNQNQNTLTCKHEGKVEKFNNICIMNLIVENVEKTRRIKAEEMI
jgi:hypothetical protein